MSFSDREMIENYWHGLKIAGDSLNKKAERLLFSTAPEMSSEVVYEDYYDIPIGPFVSNPLKLDPTSDEQNYVIIPLNKVLIDPEYDSNFNPVFNDMIEISSYDYYKIRSIGLECYVVVKVNKDGISDRYFEISNLLSSEEEGDRYYQPSNVDNPSTYKYMIKVSGNLAYIGDNSFSIYLTTGRSYNIDSWVISLPTLQTHITPGYQVEFKLDIDYTLYDGIVEFNNNIFKNNGIVINDAILYCPKVSIIENFLYDMYGKMVNMPDWSMYNHDNYSGKTAISSVMKGLQDGSNLVDYCRAFNAYYGLPIAPQNSKVVGLYESYAYSISSISTNQVVLNIPVGVALHPFIQSGTRFFVEGKSEVKVDYIVDRNTGIIMLTDASELTLNDKMNIKLKNSFAIKQIVAETDSDNAYVIVYTNEGAGAIQHFIDTVQLLTDNKKYPEIIIYDTENFTENYNGIYHIVSAEVYTEGFVKLKFYKKPEDSEPLYNDFIYKDFINPSIEIFHGYVHIPWPTHKFLYLYMDNKVYYKAYLDSPIDTIYDENDRVNKYQILSRNASVFTKNMFPDWNQFDYFKRYNGINFESDTLEVTRILPGGTFGSYFPSLVV